MENSGVTHLLMQWGQFLDHDITSSSQSRGFNGSVPRCCKDGGRDFIPKEFMVISILFFLLLIMRSI